MTDAQIEAAAVALHEGYRNWLRTTDSTLFAKIDPGPWCEMPPHTQDKYRYCAAAALEAAAKLNPTEAACVR